ncbi:CHAT domain-containing protein [Bounagaea algeriensis]
MSDDARPASSSGGRHEVRSEQTRSAPGWFSREHVDGTPPPEPTPPEPAPPEPTPPAAAPAADPAASAPRGTGTAPAPGAGQPDNRPPVATTGENPRRTPEQRYADALAAMNRIVSTRDFSALPWVTEVFRATAGVLAEHDPARASVLNNLGTAAQLTFATSADVADLEDAIAYYRSAVTAAPRTDEDLLLYRNNLVLALIEHATRSRSAESSAQAAAHARETARLTPRGDPRRHVAAVRLATSLRTHARVASDNGADEESIDAFREAARNAPEGEAPELLVNLGAALTRRAQRSGDPAALDESVHHLRTGASSLPEGTGRHRAQCYLASALRLRFHVSGDVADLHTAVVELLGVVAAVAEGGPLLGRAARHLAECALDHVDATGEPQLLQQVLRPLASAAHTMRGDDPYRVAVLALYGALARRQHAQQPDAAALDTAVTAGEEALRHVADAAADPVRLSLIRSLVTRHEHSGGTADLDRAAEVAGHLAVDTIAEGYGASPVAAQNTAVRGELSLRRYRLTRREGDLDGAIQRLAQGLGGIPDGMPARADVALRLGEALRELHRRSGRRRNYRWARKVLTEAAEQSTAPADQRLRAAETAARLAADAQRWSDAAESFSQAVQLLPLVPRGKRVVASPEVQRDWALLTADAVACTIEAGLPQRAVELLEHGRTAVLTDFLPTGGELGALHRGKPELADEAVRLRRLLDRPTAEPVLTPVDDRTRSADAWHELLGRIRTVDSEHLRPAPFDELATTAAQAGADYGAIVLPNISRYRSDALIVFGGRLVTVPLPGASPEAVTEQAHTALDAALRRDEQRLGECLHWSWEQLVRPVLERMGYHRSPGSGQRWPRVWWCTHGSTAHLPLHAATAADGTSALECVVSSYVPTLGALRRTRGQQPAETSALVAAGSAGGPARELPPRNQVVARYWPGAEVLGADASTDEVLRRLPRAGWVHVCERSAAYPSRPAAASVLSREPEASLGVVEIGQVRLEAAELCVLGHCATAAEVPSPAAVCLPAILGFAGYAHVLGSLWEAAERNACTALEGVYGEVVGGELDHASYALHDASRRLRDEHPDAPSQWAPFVHVGP